LKRIIVWIDSADYDAPQVEKRLKEYLSKAGIRYTMFEACEIMDSENE